MSLKEKQLIEKNARAFWVGSFIILLIAVLGALGLFQNASKVMCIVRLCLTIAAYVGFVFCHKMHKDSGKFMISGSICLIIAYCLLLFTTPQLYLYSIMYPVALFVMFFMDKQFTGFAAIACAICNIMFAIKVEGDASQKFINLVFALSSCAIVYAIVALQDKQKTESAEEIERNGKEQELLTGKIEKTNKDVAGNLQLAYNVADELTDKIDAAIVASEQISDGSRATAESIQHQSRMTQDISESLQLISDKTREMLSSSNDTIMEVSVGNEYLSKLENQANIVKDINAETTALTTELQEDANAVKDILSTILAISSQTNLLALNASIEAARAGEAGKSFAVVADEIRNLSEQTKVSAEKIGQTITVLLDTISKTSDNIGLTIDTVSQQNELIEQTGERFKTISASTNALSGRINDISEEVTSCVKANTEVVDSISTLSATSEQLSASSESSLNVANGCKDMMEEMNGILNTIRDISK